MSQTDLAKAVGLTFQQVQKYERGTNRVSASRLFEFAKVLDVPVSHFFGELSPVAKDGEHKSRRLTAKAREADMNSKRETLQLVRAYYKIGNADVRKHIHDMVKAL